MHAIFVASQETLALQFLFGYTRILEFDAGKAAALVSVPRM
ncbi:hypothetical protein [Ancylobacter sonchi]|nr:hypothetical protein [Ancylobacter sonchi]